MDEWMDGWMEWNEMDEWNGMDGWMNGMNE